MLVYRPRSGSDNLSPDKVGTTTLRKHDLSVFKSLLLNDTMDDDEEVFDVADADSRPPSVIIDHGIPQYAFM